MQSRDRYEGLCRGAGFAWADHAFSAERNVARFLAACEQAAARRESGAP
jgi:hypothetical protein